MKTKLSQLQIWLTAGFCLIALHRAVADGSLHLNNTSSTLVYERDSLTLSLSPVAVGGGKVEFLWAAVGNLDLSSYQTVPGVSPINIAPVPGRFILSPQVTIHGIPDGSVVSAFMRGWTGPYSSWADALASGNSKLGVSDLFLVDTGNPNEIPPEIPANIVSSVPDHGFNGLILGAPDLLNPSVVPEPTSIVLAGFGAASLLIFRRRK